MYELISFKGPMTATVTVGPAPPKLAGKDPKEWKPKQVAESVLSDRATGRIATGQKVSLAEVEFARGEKIGDIDYVYYEYISQGSPNLAERESTTFRHSLGVTARRGAYLYTYTISAPRRCGTSTPPGSSRESRRSSSSSGTRRSSASLGSGTHTAAQTRRTGPAKERSSAQ